MGNSMGNIRCVCSLPCNDKRSGKQAQPADGTAPASLLRGRRYWSGSGSVVVKSKPSDPGGGHGGNCLD